MYSLILVLRTLMKVGLPLTHPLAETPDLSSLKLTSHEQELVLQASGVIGQLSEILMPLFPGFQEVLERVAREDEVVPEEFELDEYYEFLSYCFEIYLLEGLVDRYAYTEVELEDGLLIPPDVTANDDEKERAGQLVIASALYTSIKARESLDTAEE